MYYKRHRLDGENNKLTHCHINNTKYLTIQRHKHGMRLWVAFAFSCRDIFRFIILLSFSCQLLPNNTVNASTICLLIPPVIFSLLFIFLKVYQEIHEPAKKWRLYIIASIVTNILSIVFLIILPSSSFYARYWKQDYGDIARLFTTCISCDDTKPLIMKLLKYILNNNKTAEIKRRIVVVNYYLTLEFTDKMNDNSLSNIDYFANMHNSNKYGLAKVNWTDLQKAAGYNTHATKARLFRTMLSLFVVIYYLFLLMFLQKKVFSSWSQLFIAFDWILLLFVDCKYFEIYWYCYHMFPFVDEKHPICEFFRPVKCGKMWRVNMDVLMDNITVLYKIMFGSLEKVTLIENVCENIHPEIVAIIGQYLRHSLPIYQSYESAKAFKLEFDNLLKSFKDCENVSMLSINTHISTNK